MRYIKLFENFDNKFEQDIKDIFVELQDKSYKISVSFWRPLKQITIYKFLGFDLEYVKEYILMFNEYMKERFNEVKFSYVVETIYQDQISLSSYEDFEKVKDELVSVKILID